jgi:YtkA-like
MRVRPFFWLLLAVSCIGIMIFASTVRVHVPVVLQVHIEQQSPAPVGLTTVKLHLTDTEGLPIEEAQVFSIAKMTNMYMVSRQSDVRYLGEGNYAAQLRLYMTGPWAITVQAQAEGFDPLNETLFLEVQ